MNADVLISSPQGVLTILGFRGVGPQMAFRMMRRFRTLGELQAAPDAGFIPLHVRTLLRERAQWDAAFSKAQFTLEDAERHGVQVLTPGHDQYPRLLPQIDDCPPVLYLKGDLRPGGRYVACVGTREPTRFGETVTRRIVSVLAEAKCSIVSGLALGIDALSHRAALDGKTHTVAILANGLDSVYPKKNAALAAEILANGGALVSEQPIGTPVVPRNLVRRDRLQSGFSLATIVMQTDIVGGSMHTVRFTLMQGRLLFVPKPSGTHANVPKSKGLVALAELKGPDLARKIGAEGDYATLLARKFADRPVAAKLTGKNDYQTMLSMLENAEREPNRGFSQISMPST